MGERGGEVRPKEHLPPGDELMPEPERELRDDLCGIEWLPVGLHPANRSRNALVRVSMATDPTCITAQLSSIVKDPVSSLSLFVLT